MDYLKKILTAFELHSPKAIEECFNNGINPGEMVNGKPLIYELINMYTRGPQFKDCIKVFTAHGYYLNDPVLLAVLLDDAIILNNLVKANNEALTKTYSFQCAFTPLYHASLLHICAEYNHLACAKILIKHGIDINIKAGIDANGFGGQTPIFHTVNQHANTCVDVMKYLLMYKADCNLALKGLIWGKGYPWETFIPAINPISYAMMGLLPQFHRKEQDVYEVVAVLMKAAFGTEYVPQNIPNKYLIT